MIDKIFQGHRRFLKILFSCNTHTYRKSLREATKDNTNTGVLVNGLVGRNTEAIYKSTAYPLAIVDVGKLRAAIVLKRLIKIYIFVTDSKR